MPSLEHLNLMAFMVINAPGTLLAAFIFWTLIRREKEIQARLADKSETLLAFGERRATLEQKLSDSVERLARAVEQIETRLQTAQICPVSQISTTQAQDIADRHRATRAELAQAVRDAIQRPDGPRP